MPQVSLQHSAFPDGEALELPALGSFLNNGDSKEVSEIQIQAFIDMGFAWPEENLSHDVVLVIPPPEPRNKDLEPDAEVTLTDEQLAALADKKENS